MKARYAYHLSRVFNHLLVLDATNVHKYLYTFIYPQIYIAVKRGKTDVDLQPPPPEFVRPQLLRDGYMIVSKNGRTNLSWSFDLEDKIEAAAMARAKALSNPAISI